ncbi:MAG: HAD family acid phosphatase [bacterium]
MVVKLVVKLPFLIVASILFQNCSREIVNLDTAKEIVREYYESRQYDEDVTRIIDDAKEKLDGINPGDNSAVVFDVDDTAISGYAYTEEIGFGYSHEHWRAWAEEANAPAIEQVKEFYDWLIERNIQVIFLTGRRNEVCNFTYKNLINAGYTKFDTLICRNDEQQKLPAAEYKTEVRTEMTKHGYEIIACVGDQETDLEGDFTGLKIKLPNYLYLTN